ncbi:MAG: hypothetical protein K8I65_12130 [Thermoanaerobaculia bacterium]|nr:hypothetical protein [Thermoanaerobaculia bacterium]
MRRAGQVLLERMRQVAGREEGVAERRHGALALGQIVVGVVNVALLAPIPLQLAHLLLADLLWIAVVLAGAARLADA